MARVNTRWTPTGKNRLTRLGAALFMLLVFVVLSWLMLATVQGQNFDALTRYAVSQGKRIFLGVDSVALETVSLDALLIITGVVMLVAVIRHRWQLGVRVLILVGGANVTTQGLKHLVLSRSDFGVDYVGLSNSLPSGHTTIALSAAVAAVMVVPHRIRGVVTIFGWIAASFVGISVMVNQWHRLGDVVGAILVVGIWAILLAPRESSRFKGGGISRLVLGISSMMSLLGLGAGILVWMGIPQVALRETVLLSMSGEPIGRLAAVAAVALTVGLTGVIVSIINFQARS